MVRRTSLTSQQWALLITPPLLLLTTFLTFNGLVAALGVKLGYFGGFCFYWIIWCLLLPYLVLKPRSLLELFHDVHPRLGRPAWLGAVLLVVPPAVAYAFYFPHALFHATLLIILTSIPLAIVNATMEEVLWRGTYVTIFPRRAVAGYLYPAVGFGIWHLAPLSIVPSTMSGGALSFAIFAVVLGLAFGWVARSTGSIRWTIVSHALLDFAGLGTLIYFR